MYPKANAVKWSIIKTMLSCQAIKKQIGTTCLGIRMWRSARRCELQLHKTDFCAIPSTFTSAPHAKGYRLLSFPFLPGKFGMNNFPAKSQSNFTSGGGTLGSPLPWWGLDDPTLSPSREKASSRPPAGLLGLGGINSFFALSKSSGTDFLKFDRSGVEVGTLKS